MSETYKDKKKKIKISNIIILQKKQKKIGLNSTTIRKLMVIVMLINNKV